MVHSPVLLDPSRLSAESLEIISKQATINIGTIGHVAHGKSTIVKGLSGIHTVKFKQEKERNITIKLGYANCKIYKCQNPSCPRPGHYASNSSKHPDRYEDEHGVWEVVRHVSFVDCPGHEVLMSTMLNGASVMDFALLLIAANEPFPRPQTKEHLEAVKIMNLDQILVVQNKCELITEAEAQHQHDLIREYLEGTCAENAPIIPISAVMKYNLDVLCEYICTQIPTPVRDFTSKAQMVIIRSFDVNKPGTDVEEIKGGVIGGSVTKGILKLGDEVEIRPGVVSRNSSGDFEAQPILTKIVSLEAEKNQLEFAVAGGLIAVGTLIDPFLTKADNLVGQILGIPGHLPPIFYQIKIEFQKLKNAVGDEATGNVKINFKEGEFLLLNVGSTEINGTIKKLEKSKMKIDLTKPICASIGDKLTISQKIDNKWRLVGHGKIYKGSDKKK